MSWCSSYSCWRTGAGELRRYLCGHPIEVLARFARIDRCDRPGHDEFAECEQQSDVDDAPQADLEQILVVGSADRQQKVIHDRDHHQAPEKQCLAPVQGNYSITRGNW